LPDVVATPAAQRGLASLRGPAKKRAEAWLDDLAARGCQAMGYRLTGDPPLDSLCCVHLRASDRAIVTFTPGTAWVLLVGPYDRQDREADIYTRVYTAAGITAGPLRARTKPPCCLDDITPPSSTTPPLTSWCRPRAPSHASADRAGCNLQPLPQGGDRSGARSPAASKGRRSGVTASVRYRRRDGAGRGARCRG